MDASAGGGAMTLALLLAISTLLAAATWHELAHYEPAPRGARKKRR